MGKQVLAGDAQMSYMVAMTKTLATSPLTVLNPQSGKMVVVRGVGALKGNPLPIKKGVDLTKPIAAQTLKHERKQKGAKGR